jgi:small subunit ribosomal protein S20
LGSGRPCWYSRSSAQGSNAQQQTSGIPAWIALTGIPTKTTRILRVANIKSQKKRILTNERARLRNQSVKSSLRTVIRSFREAQAAGDKDKASEILLDAGRKLDKAASKGVIHKNQAANKKSALAQAFNKI